MKMEKIIAKVDKMVDRCIVTIDDIDRVYMEEVSFSKGNYKFEIDSDNDVITLEIYQTETHTTKAGERIQVIREEGTYYTSESEDFILKKLSEIINNKELYKERAKELKVDLEKLADSVLYYTTMRNESTTNEEEKKYTRFMNTSLQKYSETTKKYMTCIKFEEHTK